MKNSKFSRRDFISLATGSIAVGALAGCAQESSDAVGDVAEAVTDMVKPAIPIGVQLYCFREMLGEDTPGSLEKIAGLGFKHVETAGYYGLAAADLKKMFDDNGLECFSAHVGMNDLSTETLAETADYHAGLGNKRLVIPGIPDSRHETREALMQTIDEMNAISTALAERGMQTGYHCHAYSFEKTFEGDTIWKIITDNTDDSFIMQLDVGNASHGSANIPEVIRQTPGRILSIHAKPYTTGAEHPFANYIGEDSLDWPSIVDLLESTGGVDQYIIEYEDESKPPLEAMAANLASFGNLTK